MVPIGDIAGALKVDPYWLSALLQKKGVDISYDGKVSLRKFLGIDRLELSLYLESLLIESKLNVAAKKNVKNQKQWIILNSETGKRATLDIRTAETTRVQSGQIGYSTVSLNWVAFLANPWGRIFVKSPTELRASRRSGRSKQNSVYVTFSVGIKTWDCTEERLQLFKDDETVWT
jgi:hypothetical protein